MVDSYNSNLPECFELETKQEWCHQFTEQYKYGQYMSRKAQLGVGGS